jgi:hypothetical protein
MAMIAIHALEQKTKSRYLLFLLKKSLQKTYRIYIIVVITL